MAQQLLTATPALEIPTPGPEAQVPRGANPETECRRVESHAPGWRCVWLPRHAVFLAYPDPAVYPGPSRPTAVADSTADQTLAAINDMGRLRDLVRGWLSLRKGNDDDGPRKHA